MPIYKFSEEFKINAIKLASNRGKCSLSDMAKELDIAKSTYRGVLK